MEIYARIIRRQVLSKVVLNFVDHLCDRYRAYVSCHDCLRLVTCNGFSAIKCERQPKGFFITGAWRCRRGYPLAIEKNTRGLANEYAQPSSQAGLRKSAQPLTSTLTL